MRIVLVHPNYHSGGAEIAGNWPPAWVAYLAGYLKNAGYTDITFIDAMTDHMSDDQVRDALRLLQPDIVGATAITPAIYAAESLLQLAKECCPNAITVLGGIHGTFMYPQVLTEAPWIDVVVRGEGEQVLLDLVACIDRGAWPAERGSVKGIAYLQDGQVTATPAAKPIADLDLIQPDWGILDWKKYIYIPTGKRVAIPNMARGCPFTCSFCSQWKFWRDYRVRDPKKVVDEIETLVRDHEVGFFILADEEPTIHKKKFIQFCEKIEARALRDRQACLAKAMEAIAQAKNRHAAELEETKMQMDKCMAKASSTMTKSLVDFIADVGGVHKDTVAARKQAKMESAAVANDVKTLQTCGEQVCANLEKRLQQITSKSEKDFKAALDAPAPLADVLAANEKATKDISSRS